MFDGLIIDGLTVFNRGSRRERKEDKIDMNGSIHVGLAALGAALGVGLIGMKASEAVGRNPVRRHKDSGPVDPGDCLR